MLSQGGTSLYWKFTQRVVFLLLFPIFVPKWKHAESTRRFFVLNCGKSSSGWLELVFHLVPSPLPLYICLIEILYHFIAKSRYFLFCVDKCRRKSFHYITSGVLNLVDLEHKIDVAAVKFQFPITFYSRVLFIQTRLLDSIKY